MKNSPRMLLLFAFFVVGGAHHLFAQAPANNNCANATLLGPAATCVPTAGTTQNATYTNAAGDCGGNQPDVWYRFVATSTETRYGWTAGFTSMG